VTTHVTILLIFAADPVVMKTLAMKEAGMPVFERFKEFPWMLAELIFPFLMEYLVRSARYTVGDEHWT
jgi:hypothetical protein